MTVEQRLAVLDELDACRQEQPARGEAIRKAMMEVGFRNGRMPREVGARLVKAGLIAAPRAQRLEDPEDEMRQLLQKYVAAQAKKRAPTWPPTPMPPPSDALLSLVRFTEATCRVAGLLHEDVEIQCEVRTGSGRCNTQVATATYRVLTTGLRLIDVKDYRDMRFCEEPASW